MAWSDAARAAALESRRRHMKSVKLVRDGPGAYTATLKKYGTRATIVRNPELHGPSKWIAYISSTVINDPVRTKSQAHRDAVSLVRGYQADLLRLRRKARKAKGR